MFFGLITDTDQLCHLESVSCTGTGIEDKDAAASMSKVLQKGREYSF